MGLAKVSLLAIMGTFIVLVGVYCYGMSTTLPSDADAKALTEVPAILMMTLGGIAVLLSLFLWVVWYRNRLVTYRV